MPVFTKSNTIQDLSNIYFRTPSNWAREHLYYIDMHGSFTCDSRYSVTRDPFDSYLFMYTHEGNGIVETPTSRHICRPRELVIVDCNRWHRYYAKDYWRFHWFHFNGGSSKALIQYILEHQGDVIPVRTTEFVITFCQLAEGKFENQLEGEIKASGLIYQLLTQLAAQSAQSHVSQRQQLSRDAASFLDEHYTEPIKVAEVAQRFGVSSSTFSHCFKAETGFSPYEYLLTRRFEQAKRLLWTTPLTISEISYQVGFQSEAHFIKLFRQRNQQTPLEFRKGRQEAMRTE